MMNTSKHEFFTWLRQSGISMAVVTSTLLTIVRTEITLVSYFSNVTSFLISLTIVRNLCLHDPIQWKWSHEITVVFFFFFLLINDVMPNSS